MWLLAKEIKRDFPDLKVLLSGEGADELLAGYLAFHHAPTLKAMNDYSMDLLRKLHTFDVQRAHQSLISHNIEARVPFLDRYFVEYCLSLDPIYKSPVLGKEKYFLRCMVQDLLPREIVWRQKEQFSDGVGYDWINTLRRADWREIVTPIETLHKYRKSTGKEQLQIFDLFYLNFGEAAFKDVCQTTKTWKPRFYGNGDASGRCQSDKHIATNIRTHASVS